MADQTPPEITNGSFVSWSNGKGRVDLIVTSGTVPGVDGDVEATADSPAARVVVWRDGKPTREKVGASTHTLRRIAPLDGEAKADPTQRLLALHRDHVEAANEAKVAPVSGVAVDASYRRGLLSWPGEEVTSLSAEEWALGRAEHLCKAAIGDVEALNDADLLPSTHALATPDAPALLDALSHGDAIDYADDEEEEEGMVEVDPDDIAATLAQIEADAAVDD